ncbi:MAG: TonB-dependent receptor [Halieaceae bacterium]
MNKLQPMLAVRPRVAPLAFTALACAININAYAQQAPQLEEVVVTAQKRAQSLSDVPLSVSAISGDKMTEAGIMDLSDLSGYVPNFNKAETPLSNYLVIRGISSGINQGFEQSVVTYVDDIAMGRSPLAGAPFMDLSRIEVLRGPQNVLFGKNSIAGALSMVTNKPSDEFEANVLAEYEFEYEAKRVEGVISGPISDKLRGRLALRYLEEDGYMDNLLTGDDDPARDEFAWRGVLAWDMGERADATLKVEQSQYDLDGRPEEILFTYTNPDATSGFFGLTYPQIAETVGGLVGQDVGSDDGRQNFKRGSNLNEHVDTDVDNATLTVNWEFDQFTLTSVTGYVEYDQDLKLNNDLTGIDAYTSKAGEDYDQFSQEIRLTSPGGQTIDWIAGAYYQDWDLKYRSDFRVDGESLWSALGVLGDATGDPSLSALGVLSNLRNERRYKGDSETWAVFAQATWNISDVTRLTLGARYTDEQKTARRRLDVFNTLTNELDIVQAATGSAVFGVDFANLGEATNGAFPIHDLNEKRGEDSFTPTGIFEWDVTEETMLYASVSTGFKAGGFDARGNRAANLEYDDETVLAYEIGAKSRLLDNRLDLNISLFRSEYDDLQVSQFDGTLGFAVGNAAEATSQGVEVDGRWLLTDGLTWTFAAAYLDFEFDSYKDGTCSSITTLLTGQELCDYSGETNVFSPEWSASTSLEYVTSVTSAIDLRANVDVNWVDDQYVEVTLNDDLEQGSYTKVNARVALETASWTLAVVGKNLTDEDINTFSVDTPLSGSLGAPAYSGYMARPRTVAIQAAYRF